MCARITNSQLAKTNEALSANDDDDDDDDDINLRPRDLLKGIRTC